MIQDCKIFRTTPEDIAQEYADEISFEFQYLARLFLFCRPPVHFTNLTSLNFAFNTGKEGPTTTKESIYPTKRFKGGLCIIKYDAEHHSSLNKQQRYLNLMSLMEEGIKPYASHLGLDMSFFETTFKRMRTMDFKGCRFILDPIKSSKDRQYKASMEVEVTERKIFFYIVFLDKGNRTAKRVLTRSERFFSVSDNTVIFSATGRWRWLSNEDFAISNMHASWNWIAARTRDGCEFRERGNYNRPYGDFSTPRIVVADEFWKMRGLE